ncbi:hypothetical protein PF007_g19078 [Phytophthora fragariae]|uniref:Uncharacterized protein n=1 Tax=Phytophthora fragariae TaxID=53985 RepID=A0A6A3R782_9STRA|nr:hypothetical protein PF007_g19078 [Phytophthora fragariae]KAE9221118.1 hypothetical protein PF004_g13137 [Phytophthora fragariae]
MLELGYFSTNRQCRRSNAKAGWGALRCGAVSSVAFSPLLGVVTASGFSLDANVGGLATGTTAVEDWTAAFKPATDGPCVTCYCWIMSLLGSSYRTALQLGSNCWISLLLSVFSDLVAHCATCS